jgi:hypothetical protein
MGQRKDFLIASLVISLLAALCVSELWLWTVGIETPEKGTPKRWIGLVGSILILGAIIFFLTLLSYTLISKALREKRKKKLVSVLSISPLNCARAVGLGLG